MLDYSLRPCEICHKPSVGFFSDLVISKYYCNSHFFARQNRENKEQEIQEFKQWGDQAWYKEAFPEKYKDPFESLSDRLRKAKKGKDNQQLNLFSL